MLRQINEPVVVGSSLETTPNTLSRPCCTNCGHRAIHASRLDKTIHCDKHRRVTFAWWWCSDHLSETEAAMRAEALTTIRLLATKEEAEE